MEAKRDLVFLYNGVEMTDESVLNVSVDLLLPVKGGVVRRRGKVWTKTDTPSRNSVYRIFLSDGH
jgi:hypothetical protein